MHKVLRFLILSDFSFLSGLGLVQPIFAVFMMREIVDSTILSIGIATTIQLVTKALFQIGVGRWTDGESGNQRRLLALLAGAILITVVPFGYVFSTNVVHIYFLQFVYGLGGSLIFPGWMVMFNRYSRADRAGYEWGIYNTVVSLGTAGTAALGAYLANYYSFSALFLTFGAFSLFGTGFIINIFKQEFIRKKIVI